MILFIGQVESSSYGKESFQEIDYVSMFSKVAKWSHQISNADEIEEIIHKAFEVSNTGSNDYQTENLLNKNICKTNLGAVTDVTDQFVLINLKGDKIYKLFETGSPFNFNDFRKKKGSVTQTILAKIDVIIQNESQNDVNLFVRRSFSQHLFSWMNDSASRL